MQDISDFEFRVLGLIKRDHLPLGDRVVHYVAAARRLERKGYAYKSRWWGVTKKGDEALQNRAAQLLRADGTTVAGQLDEQDNLAEDRQ